jgi:hypothetical protein
MNQGEEEEKKRKRKKKKREDKVDKGRSYMSLQVTDFPIVT